MKQLDADNLGQAGRCSLENQPGNISPSGTITKFKTFDYAQYTLPHLGSQL